MYLGIELTDKTETKDEVVGILKNTGYDVTVYLGYCIRPETIQLLEEGKYFKIKV